MNLKLLFLIAATIIASAAYYEYSNHHDDLSDMQLANIEALYYGEFIVGKGWECFGKIYDDVENPQFITVINCDGCHVTSAVYVNKPAFCTLSGMYD